MAAKVKPLGLDVTMNAESVEMKPPFETNFCITKRDGNTSSSRYVISKVAIERADGAGYVFGQAGPICSVISGLKCMLQEYAKACTRPILDHSTGAVVAPSPLKTVEELLKFKPTQTAWDYRIGLDNQGRYAIYQVGTGEEAFGSRVLYSRDSVCSTGEGSVNEILSDLNLYCGAASKPIFFLDWVK